MKPRCAGQGFDFCEDCANQEDPDECNQCEDGDNFDPCEFEDAARILTPIFMKVIA